MLFHTCILPVSEGVHTPVGFWRRGETLGFDYYTEQTQVEVDPMAVAGLLVLVDLDEEEAEELTTLDARHLGYHEQDSW